MMTEDNSAENWRSALEDDKGNFDSSELVWYSDEESIEYSGIPTPAQTEAARRFVSNWLENDSHGFVIPGTEWGRSMKHWINILVARPAEGMENADDPEQAERDAEADYLDRQLHVILGQIANNKKRTKDAKKKKD